MSSNKLAEMMSNGSTEEIKIHRKILMYRFESDIVFGAPYSQIRVIPQSLKGLRLGLWDKIVLYMG
jgi:hypothetical protein